MQGEHRGDFTRDTFHRANHFCRVLMQQGRVQLDADWNEQTAITLHFLRSLAGDLIGQHGGPGPYPGFNIQTIANPGSNAGDLVIGGGHYYVDGLLCESDSALVTASFPTPIANPPTTITIAAMAGQANFQNGQWLEILYVKKGDTASSSYFANITNVSADTLTIAGLVPAYANDISGTFQVRRASTFLKQRDYPNPNLKLPQQGFFLVYLDVWERHITSVQQDQIREVALGGPDTASRAQLVWQVKLFTQAQEKSFTTDGHASPFNSLKNLAAPKQNVPAPKVNFSDAVWQSFIDRYLLPVNRGWLAAQVQTQPASTDPCVISPQSAYRGVENQLYRVEIHTGGSGVWNGNLDATTNQPDLTGLNGLSPVTFKFSRENGSVVFPILKLATTSGAENNTSITTVTLASLGRDRRLSLKVNDWVEVVDDVSDLSASDPLSVPGSLLQVQNVDLASMVVTLAGTTAIAVDQSPTKHPLLRRWDQQQGDGETNNLNLGADGGALLAEGAWLNLEDGIQIQLQTPPAGQTNQYRSGDYWLIPARVATGDIEWPKLRDAQGNLAHDPTTKQPTPAALPPHGVEHHYAPLAFISGANPAVNLRRTFTTQAA